MSLSTKHKKTLRVIFEKPVRSNIVWTDIESMLLAMGAEILEAKGSRIIIVLNGLRKVFHRPHPQKETDKGAIVSMKRFLQESGVLKKYGI